ncbi:MAG TPA: DUF4089 domain-containing protein [Paenirhodobacter sp.]
MMTDDAYIDAASALVGLSIAEPWRPGVRRFLQVAAEMAATLQAVPLDDGELALASVYRLPDASAPADRKDSADA